MARKTSKNHGKAEPVSANAGTKTKAVEGTSPSKGSTRTRRKQSRNILPEDRYRRIAEAAYFIAERRGFANGRCEEDWYEAERIIMNNLQGE